MSKIYNYANARRLLSFTIIILGSFSLAQAQRGGIEKPNSICQGDTVNFSYEKGAGSDVSSYNWSFGKNAEIIGSKYASSTQVVFNKAGSFTATMTTTNSRGENTETSESITVNNCCDFTATITASTDTICYGDYVYVTAADQGDEYYYDWDYGTNGNAASSSGIGPHYVYFTTTGNHTISLGVGKICNCDNCAEQTDQVSVYVKPRPTLNVSINNTNGCNYINSNYTASTPFEAGATYNWNAGDGSITGSGNFVTVSWPSDGSKQLCVSSDLEGCVSTKCENVSVIDATCPTANFNLPTEICQGYNFTLNADDEGYGASYSWTFTGASASSRSGINASNSFTQTGTQTVTLTVSKCGCTNSVLSKTVTVKPTPNANISGPSCGNTNTNLVFTAAAFSGATYDWTLSNGGTGSSSTNSITASWANEGDESVCLTASYNGCEDSDCHNVQVVSSACPTAGFSLPDTICQNAYYLISANDQGFGTDYNWDFGSGIYSGSNSGKGPIYLVFNQSGDQTIELTVSKCHCSDDTETKTIYVVPEPTAAITGNEFNYVDSTVSFTTPFIAGATYLWTIDGTPQNTYTNTLTIVFNSIGYKNVCVTVTEGNTCSTNDCFTTGIIEYDCPEAIINAPSQICVGGIATFIAEDQGCGVDYYWQIAGVNYQGMTQQTTFNSPGSYPIQLIITTCGCNHCGSDTVNTTITVVPTPTADISGATTGLINTDYTFSTPAVTGATYTWTTDGGTGSSTTNVIDVQWSTTGTKTVCVTVSSGSCNAQDCHDILIEEPNGNDTCVYDAEFDFKLLGYQADIDSSTLIDGGNSSASFYLFQPNSNTIQFRTDDVYLRNNTPDTTGYWSINTYTKDSVRLLFNQSIESLEFDIYDIDFFKDNSSKSTECVTVVPYIGGSPVSLTPNDYTLGTLITATNNTFCNESQSVPSNSNAGDVSFAFTFDVDSIHIKFVPESSGNLSISNHDLGISDMHHCSTVPVPVEWLFVNAKKEGDVVRVNWATAMEVDNHLFEVERLANGEKFTKIGEVLGAGQSSTIQYYNQLDPSPAAGINYYRIKQIDFNGAFEYTEVVAVSMLESGQIGIKPNPTKDAVILFTKNKLNEGTEIKVTDTYGKLHRVVRTTGQTSEVDIDLSELSTGVYFISFSHNGIIHTERVLLEN